MKWLRKWPNISGVEIWHSAATLLDPAFPFRAFKTAVPVGDIAMLQCSEFVPAERTRGRDQNSVLSVNHRDDFVYYTSASPSIIFDITV